MAEGELTLQTIEDYFKRYEEPREDRILVPASQEAMWQKMIDEVYGPAPQDTGEGTGGQ